MGYKHIVHNDASKHEHIWIRTDHFHELFIADPASPSYIDVSHLSRIFAQPLIVLFAGHGRWFENEGLKRQTQANVLGIEYIRSGNVAVTKGRKERLVEAGEVYFIRGDFPDADHTGPAGALSKRYVWLTGSVLENLLRSVNLWQEQVVRVQRPRQFEALLRQMTRLLNEDPPDVDMRASVLAYQIILFLGQSLQPALPSLLEHALAFMQKNLHCQLQMKDLCGYLGVNDIHLRRLFSRHIKVSPMTYFHKQKLTWSANLLSTSSLPIKEIAYEIGYDDPLYFSNQFKKCFGISPKQYRESNSFSLGVAAEDEHA